MLVEEVGEGAQGRLERDPFGLQFEIAEVEGWARGLTRRASVRAPAVGDQNGPLSGGHLVDQHLEALAFLDPSGGLLAQGDGDGRKTNAF